MRVDALWNRVRSLRHGRHRTFGAPALYAAFRDQMIRRHIRPLVRAVRQEITRQERAEQRRVEWRKSGVIWSMDELECRNLAGKTVFWLQIQDLGSRYKFGPFMMLHKPTSVEIAEILRSLFQRYGAPLFLKRDNGGNLNGWEINAVLDEFLVIPLNSPPHYPPYNGGIEEAQREFQDVLTVRMAADPDVASHLLLTTEVIANELNHRLRECLDWQCSCVRFFTGRKESNQYNRTQRKEVYRQILAIVEDMTACLDEPDEQAAQAIWRRAVETWMQARGLILIREPKECNPFFSKKWSH